MKVLMQGSVSIAANSTNNNILQGQRYERSPFPAVGTLYVNGSAAGLVGELNVGGASVSGPVTCNASNRVPVIPDDLLVTDWEAVPNALIQVSITNTTGGALTAYWKVELQEVRVRRG